MEKIALSIQNELPQMARVNRELADFLEKRGQPANVVFQLELACEEILTNIINYGFEPGCRSAIEIEIELVAQTVIITFIDEGRPFNPLETQPVDLERHRREKIVGGLGLHLVCNMVDEMDYMRRGEKNIFVIRKRLPKNARPKGETK